MDREKEGQVFGNEKVMRYWSFTVGGLNEELITEEGIRKELTYVGYMENRGFPLVFGINVRS
jgi:hypothetical protein